MPLYNTLWAVAELIEAPDGEVALATLRNRLRLAGFNPYEGTPDLVPESYQLTYSSEAYGDEPDGTSG